MLIRILLLVFITHCTLIIAGSDKVLVNEVKAKCREEHHVEEEEIQHLNKTRRVETSDERIKCFLKCFFIGLKLMNEKGELTLDDTSDRNMKYKKHYAACKGVTGADPCEKAANFQNCMWEQLDKEGKTNA